MRFNIYRETRIGLLILAIVLSFSIVFYFFVSMFTSMGYKGYRNAKNANLTPKFASETIIIDAGHGGEDPGASVGGILEKNLNLQVSNKLNDFLIASGYSTYLTRTEDKLLYKEGQENRKKFYDLHNREEITNNFNNAIFVSIHMNKFPIESCKGLQTFYSTNAPESKTIAELIQSNSKLLQEDNKRVIKPGNETIYLLKNLKIPAVLIECGFLSNPKELSLLTNEEYQKAIALSIYFGIAEYLEN